MTASTPAGSHPGPSGQGASASGAGAPPTPEAAADPAVAVNRTFWEAIAPHRLGEPVEFFRSGGSALTTAETAAIGEVSGRRVLQLAAAVGDESISLAQRGARVTAVDLAAAHLATGRAKAAELGLDVDFVEQDMIRLDPALTGFDMVLISSGGICWVPDLETWARSIATRIVPGGRLVISEHHPLWEVLTVNGENALTVSGDYFSPARDGYADPSKAPQVIQRDGLTEPASRSFVWGVGAVVCALLGAGLVIHSLRESAEPALYPGFGAAAAAIPASYLLTAMRPG